jgi:hypothetical protein
MDGREEIAFMLHVPNKLFPVAFVTSKYIENPSEP